MSMARGWGEVTSSDEPDFFLFPPGFIRSRSGVSRDGNRIHFGYSVSCCDDDENRIRPHV